MNAPWIGGARHQMKDENDPAKAKMYFVRLRFPYFRSKCNLVWTRSKCVIFATRNTHRMQCRVYGEWNARAKRREIRHNYCQKQIFFWFVCYFESRNKSKRIGKRIWWNEYRTERKRIDSIPGCPLIYFMPQNNIIKWAHFLSVRCSKRRALIDSSRVEDWCVKNERITSTVQCCLNGEVIFVRAIVVRSRNVDNELTDNGSRTCDYYFLMAELLLRQSINIPFPKDEYADELMSKDLRRTTVPFFANKKHLRQ